MPTFSRWMPRTKSGVAGVMLLSVIGWIPMLAVVGVGTFALYKLLSGPKQSS